MKRVVRATTGTTDNLIDALNSRIDTLDDGVMTSTDVNAESDVEEDDADYRYEIQDTRGLPQTGQYDSYKFEEWYELEEFLDENPEVMESIENGYATIVEL